MHFFFSLTEDGAEGEDRYYWTFGDGNDSIFEFADGSANYLVFYGGVKEADISVLSGTGFTIYSIAGARGGTLTVAGPPLTVQWIA